MSLRGYSGASTVQPDACELRMGFTLENGRCPRTHSLFSVLPLGLQSLKDPPLGLCRGSRLPHQGRHVSASPGPRPGSGSCCTACWMVVPGPGHTGFPGWVPGLGHQLSWVDPWAGSTGSPGWVPGLGHWLSWADPWAGSTGSPGWGPGPGALALLG